MKFDKFRITASPFITDAYCACGTELREVPDGRLSSAMFCPKCESVYTLKLIKLPKKQISAEYLKQAREDAKRS